METRRHHQRNGDRHRLPRREPYEAEREQELLVLDEPSAGLAPQVVDEVFATVKRINARGVSILMVEQKARQCLAMSHYGYVLDMGQNRLQGSGEQLLNDREVTDLYLGNRGRLGVAALRLRHK